jgi:hypothetical protein
MKIGDKFGMLSVMGFDRIPLKRGIQVQVKCDCGTEKLVSKGNLAYGRTTSCGCGSRKHFAEVGQIFSRLTVVSSDLQKTDRGTLVLCRCECGTEKMINILSLHAGDTKSCGCLRSEVSSSKALLHGCVGRPGYNLWHAMRSRCLNPDASGYENYGGRGIKICDEWLDDCRAFCDWVDENGYAPGLELDRIENEGDYSPSNCHFTTKVTNMRNTRSNVFVCAFGETKTVADWAEDARCSVSYEAFRERVKKGIAPELAMSAKEQPGVPLAGRI